MSFDCKRDLVSLSAGVPVKEVEQLQQVSLVVIAAHLFVLQRGIWIKGCFLHMDQ